MPVFHAVVTKRPIVPIQTARLMRRKASGNVALFATERVPALSAKALGESVVTTVRPVEALVNVAPAKVMAAII